MLGLVAQRMCNVNVINKANVYIQPVTSTVYSLLVYQQPKAEEWPMAIGLRGKAVVDLSSVALFTT